MLKRRTIFCLAMACVLAVAGTAVAVEADYSCVVTSLEDTAAPDSVVSFEIEVANAGPNRTFDDLNMTITLPMGVPMPFNEYLALGPNDPETGEGPQNDVDDAWFDVANFMIDDNIWDDDVSGIFMGETFNNSCAGIVVQPQSIILPAGASGKFYFDTVLPSSGGVSGLAYNKVGGEQVVIDLYGRGGCNSDLFDTCGNGDPALGIPCMGPALTQHPTTGAPITVAVAEPGGDNGEPGEGCGTFTNFPAGHIAIIDRGACYFNVKAENAEAAGASGVIIANYSTLTDWIPTHDSIGGLGCTDATCHSLLMTIPAAMISYNAGVALKAAIAEGEVTFFMGVRDEDPEYKQMKANIWENSRIDPDMANNYSTGKTILGSAGPGPCTPIYIAAAAAFPNNIPPWASDLGINNSGDEDLTYKFQFLPKDVDNTDVAYTDEMTLAPNTSANFVDVWNTYAGEGAGSINVCVSDPDAASVTSRIYTTTDDGTLGQGFVGIQGMTPEKLIGTGEMVRLGFLSQTGTRNNGIGFRTNVGFMNAGGNLITIDVDFYGADGTFLGSRNTPVQPYSSVQWNDAFNGVPGIDNNTWDLGYIDVSSNTENAMFLTYASVIDNASNDPTTIWPFDTTQMVGGESFDCTPVWVAAAASFPNNNPAWASDLGLTNLGDSELTYKFQFLPRGDDNTAVAMSDPFTLGANQAIAYSDIWAMTGGSGAGAINVCVDNADNAGIVSRIYSIGDIGTFGQSFDGRRGTAPAKVATGETVRLSYLFQNATYRTNIGFMNAGATAITVMAEFFDMDGNSLGTKGIDLAPYSNNQWNKAFTLAPINASNIEAGFVDVWTDTADANFLTYASIVDNGTGDPSTVWPN